MKWKNGLLLLLTATIWGVAFVAQSVGMEYIGPFTFNAVRCSIGGAVLIPVIFLADWLEKREGQGKKNRNMVATQVCRGGQPSLYSSRLAFTR